MKASSTMTVLEIICFQLPPGQALISLPCSPTRLYLIKGYAKQFYERQVRVQFVSLRSQLYVGFFGILWLLTFCVAFSNKWNEGVFFCCRTLILFLFYRTAAMLGPLLTSPIVDSRVLLVKRRHFEAGS